MGSDDVDGDVVLQHPEVGALFRGGEQSALDLAAGDVLGVENAPLGMATFLAEVEFPRAVAGGQLPFRELHAQGDQLGDARRPFLDDGADDAFLAEARAGHQGVPHVHFEGVFLARDGGDAALGVIGVRVGALLLRDDRHGAVLGRLQGEGQAGDAGADDQIIELLNRAGHDIASRRGAL